MSGHADTIRMCIRQFVPEGGKDERGFHHPPLRAECLKDLDALLAENQRLRDALILVRDNAESWHGPPEAGGGHARALFVIAERCREALAGDAE